MANYTSAYTGALIDTAVSKMNSITYDADTINELLDKINNIEYTAALINNTLSNLTSIADQAFQNSAVTVWSDVLNGVSVVIRKYGKICTFTINGQLSAAFASWAPFFTIATGYRTAQEVYHLFPDTLLIINPNGTIYSSAALASGRWVQFSISYICA